MMLRRRISRSVISSPLMDGKNLEDFVTPGSWEELSEEEREVLALLFVQRAEEGDLEHAARIAPSSATVHYWQGISHLNRGLRDGQREAVDAAIAKFREAIECDVGHKESVHGVAVALFGLVLQFDEVEKILESNEMFEQAALSYGTDEATLAKVYWDWGKLWLLSSQHSKEPVDLKRSISKFHQAEEAGLEEPSFWLDYAKALSDLAIGMGDEAAMGRAIGYYQKLLAITGDQPNIWIMIATTLGDFFVTTGNQEQLEGALDAFERAVDQLGEQPQILLAWAETLLTAGTVLDEDRYFEASLEKLRKLEETPEQLTLLLRVLVELGVDGRLEHLNEARALGEKGIKTYGDNPDIWCRLGEVYDALAHYFDDQALVRKAIGAYRQTLILDKTTIGGHVGLALSYYHIGCQEQSVPYLKKSSQHAGHVAQTDPGDANAFHQWGLSLGLIAELEGNEELLLEAVKRLETAVALRGGLDGNYPAHWLLDIAHARHVVGEPEHLQMAASLYLYYLQKEPDESSVRGHLSTTLQHLGDATGEITCYEQAIEQIQMAVRQDPRSETLWDEWGCALIGYSRLIDDPAHGYEVSKMRIEAQEKLTQAVSLGSLEALYHFAWLYAQAGDHPRAIHFLERAKAAGVLPPPALLAQDEYLGDLRSTPRFKAFL